MKSRSIRHGYVPLPGKVDKYPFHLLKPGTCIAEPYPWADRANVKAAVRYFERTRGMKLHINEYPEDRIMVVGRPETGGDADAGMNLFRGFQIVRELPEAYAPGYTVRIKVEIRHNPTGEIRGYDDTAWFLELDGDCPCSSDWSEREYSLESKRRQFFIRAGGVKTARQRRYDKGDFVVRLSNPMDGKVYYSDFDE